MNTPSGLSGGTSAVRTGLSAGTALLGGVALGVALAAVSLCVLFYYLSRWLGGDATQMGGFLPGAGQGGWSGGVWALLSPRVLVAVMLGALIPAYFFAGTQVGRARAVARVVQRHGEGLAQRLADLLAARIEALPRAHHALHRGSDLLSQREVMGAVAPWLGRGRVVRALVRFVLARLPMAEIQRQWQEARAEHGDAAQTGDAALRTLLRNNLHETVQELAAPSYQWLWILMGIQALVLALGIWLTV